MSDQETPLQEEPLNSPSETLNVSNDLVNDKVGHGRRISPNQSRPKRQGRHGARNQHRHKHFAKWLMQTFPHLKQQDPNTHVLDVAGGKGELAARLSFCHQLHVVMVDPRESNVAACFESTVLPKLPKKWQERLKGQQQENPNFIHKVADSRFRQIVNTFEDHTLATSQELQEAVRNASLLIGMHADGATEAIVDAALQFEKPFVVVPCCVFPRLFSERTLYQDGKMVPVRTHEQFCRYLLEKDSRFVMEVLPFEGRNVAIWWDGDCTESKAQDIGLLHEGSL